MAIYITLAANWGVESQKCDRLCVIIFMAFDSQQTQ